MTIFRTIEEKINAFLETNDSIVSAITTPNYTTTTITEENTTSKGEIIKAKQSTPTAEHVLDEILDSLKIETKENSTNTTVNGKENSDNIFYIKEITLHDTEKRIMFDMADEHFHSNYHACQKELEKDRADIAKLKEITVKKSQLFTKPLNEIKLLCYDELVIIMRRHERVTSFYVHRELMLLNLDSLFKYSN